ncbi:MAG: CotH kinase family protein [Bacteroidetes bacterium]|nr:CotH kinase family protein [Bacteroidota bacterium]
MKRFFLFAGISISLTSKIFAADGDSIWAVPIIHDIYLNYSQTDYWDSLVNTHVTDTYMQTTMIFDGRTMIVGSKFKGNSSYNNPSNKKSFKIDLNYYDSTQRYDGIKKINLNNGFKDPTLLREKIALDFMRAHGVNAPRCTYARVFLNNVYWGVYTIVEDIDSKFLKQNYPDNNGNLYKGDPSGDFRWYGSTPSLYYSHYELESDSNYTSWNDLVHIIKIANNTSTATLYDSLETVFDSWSFLNYMANVNAFVNLDSYIGSGHNYYTYDDSNYTHFRWIAWDVNESFGNFNLGMTISQLENLNYDYLDQPTSRPLANNMLANSNYRQMYIDAMCNVMQDFNNAYLDPIIDSLANAIRADVYADTLMTYTTQQFEDDIVADIQVPGGPGGGWIPGLKSFITARNASLTSQLSPLGCWTNVNETNINAEQLSVYPNPSSTTASVHIPSGMKGNAIQIRITDVSGKEMFNENFNSQSSETFNFSTEQFPNGMYFLTLSDAENGAAAVKFVVSH